MFGISFTEFLVIAVAAILFVGPEKLPELAQKLGDWLRTFRIMRDDFTRKINQPLDLSAPPKQNNTTPTPEQTSPPQKADDHP